MDKDNKPEKSGRKKSKILHYFTITLVIAFLIIAAKVFHLQEILQNALIWIKTLGFWAPIAFIFIYNLATILLIPGSVLTLGGGLIFGIFQGSIYVFVAATLGATFAFLIGRYLSRAWVLKKIEGNVKFQDIDRAIANSGFKIVFLTRLSPIFPFNLLNYAFGVTQVSIKDYVLGSLGMIPGTVMYVYLGSLAGDIAMLGKSVATNPQAEMVQWIIRIVGLVATVAVTLYVTKIAKQALDKEVE
jgi:uncharacterized membrane protein YdjX (TVP38/TMEM64 family)